MKWRQEFLIGLVFCILGAIVFVGVFIMMAMEVEASIWWAICWTFLLWLGFALFGFGLFIISDFDFID